MDEFLDLSKLASQLDSNNKIIEAISEKLKQVLEKNPSGFINFLYRFDLPEIQVAPFLVMPIDYKSIAELIWQRQLKKMENWRKV